MTDVKITISQEEIMRLWQKPPGDPVVSVCCPVFNHAAFLEETLRGILSQVTDFPFEVLIHDDASTDQTAHVASEYTRAYPDIVKLVRQTENQWSKGHQICAEFLLPLARGCYIAICEGDDYWVDPAKLQKQVDFMEANPDYALCFGDCLGLVHETGERVPVSGVRWDLSCEDLQRVPSVFTLTACFRNVLGEWPRELSRAPYGDMLFWTLLGDHGKGKYLQELGPSVYRLHEAGLHSLKSRHTQMEKALETFMVLFLYRLRRGDRALAMTHLQDIVVYAIKLGGVALWRGIASRAWRRLRRKLAAGGGR
ncbi:MAG: glycosyltransferase [Halieaceae bacterium]|jgi:glycosyltransferase involved in cell wall biosynthesis|nr:glycosyltransferase [Halieaceae bacterium]